MSSTYQMSILQWQYWLLTKLLKPFLLTFDLWLNFDSLNFDSSIWIMTPGPPSLGIECKIKACQATSLHFRAILMRTLRDAIPSKNMALKESFWAHFQRNWTCRYSESLLPSKNDPLRSDFTSPHRLHFLSIQSYLLSQNNPFHLFLWLGINTLRIICYLLAFYLPLISIRFPSANNNFHPVCTSRSINISFQEPFPL